MAAVQRCDDAWREAERFDDVTASEAMTRWPAWHVPAETEVLYQANTGADRSSSAKTAASCYAERPRLASLRQ